MLDCRAVHAHYGSVEALSSVDLQVREGEIVCLLGSNGAGKSSLLGAISSSGPAHVTGSILFAGKDMVGVSTEVTVRHGISHAPEGRQLFGELTVEENLRLGAYLRRDHAGITADLTAIWALFPRLFERRRQMAATLSGGEQQMAAIGRALMSRPKLLLLDEPSLGLAPTLVREMMLLVRRINVSGVSVLLVEQNAKQALQIADRGYVLEKGRVVSQGDAQSLLNDSHVVNAYLGGNSSSHQRGGKS